MIDVQEGIEKKYISYVKYGQKDLKDQLPERPEWFDIKYGQDDLTSGRILASFNFYEEPPLVILRQLSQPLQKYHVNIKVLGVRGLVSLGIIPVKRPFIRFDINSLRMPSERSSVKEKGHLQTEPKESGPDANISTTI